MSMINCQLPLTLTLTHIGKDINFLLTPTVNFNPNSYGQASYMELNLLSYSHS